MRNPEVYEASFILCKYISENVRYSAGTFSRLPIYNNMLKEYEIRDLRSAFEFLSDLGILKSSVYESNGFIIMYGFDSARLNLYTELFWQEASYNSKRKCKSILVEKEFVY